MRIPIPVLVALALTALSTEPAATQDVVVIVNASNPVSELSRAEVARLFLRRQTRWESGGAVTPVDLPEGSDLRSEFSTSILGRSMQAVRSYWQREVFSGGQSPPPTRATEAAVLEFVRTNPGAIGYVTRGTPLGDGVRVLTVTGR